MNGCGSETAYRWHLRRGERPCDVCRAEHSRLQAEYRESAKAGRKPRELVPCGNESAYRRHLRRREVPCQACCDAHADEIRTYLQRRSVA